MQIKSALLFLLFISIVPNLGFFTIPSFLIISLITVTLLSELFWKTSFLDSTKPSIILILLLFYSSIYYGGLYQNPSSINFGNALIFIVAVIVLINYFNNKLLRKYILFLIILVYIVISIWTIVNSPHPRVDAFIQQKEAPLKLMQGINPYDSRYTKVYSNVEPNYFGYLPFSFIYHIPFLLLFSDPRYSIIFSNLISIYVIFKLFKLKNKKSESYPFIATFLFLPRSFYMLEHMYLDPVVFSFFLLFVYFYAKKHFSLSFFLLSLFFSFKQHLIFLLPLITHSIYRKISEIKNVIAFLLPFLLPLLFFFINPEAFMRNVVFFFNPQKIPAPVSQSLSLSTFIIHYILKSTSIYLNVILFMFFAFLYVLIIKRTGTAFVPKLALSLLIFNFFMYHSFYNHYYLVALFLLFDIICEYLTIKI